MQYIFTGILFYSDWMEWKFRNFESKLSNLPKKKRTKFLPFILPDKSVWWACKDKWDGFATEAESGLDPACRSVLLGGGVKGWGQARPPGLGGPPGYEGAWSSTLKACGDSSLNQSSNQDLNQKSCKLLKKRGLRLGLLPPLHFTSPVKLYHV